MKPSPRTTLVAAGPRQNQLPSEDRCRSVKCPTCGGPLRLIALIKTEPIIKKILAAMHLPTEPPQLHPPRPPPGPRREEGDGEPAGGEDWLN